MEYILRKTVMYVDMVINVEGSCTQGLVLLRIPKEIAEQKRDLAQRIEQEIRMLQKKILLR